MSVLRRLLAGLPQYLDREPDDVAAIRLTYSGSAFATIAKRTLTVKTPDASQGFSVSLRGLTLSGLVANLDARPGFDAILLASDGTVGAESLLDVEGRDLGANNVLRASTSVLWGLLRPIAGAIEDTIDNSKAGVLQLSVKTADGLWLDHWGDELYGGVARLTGEQDRAYAERIIREAIRWRVNERAIERIIEEDLDLSATVTNLHDQAWVIGQTPFGKLAGRKYSRTTFEVAVDGFADGLAALIDRNRAAGTLPYVRYVSTVGALAQPGADRRDAHTTLKVRVRVAPPRVWRVAETRLGDLPIALPNDLEIASTIGVRSVETVTSQAAGTPFVLGLSDLGGADVLGDPGSGIAISDSVTSGVV